MPTALPEWTTERPDVPGFYWWRDGLVCAPQVVEVTPAGKWFCCGEGQAFSLERRGSNDLWWPVRLEHPPVG